MSSNQSKDNTVKQQQVLDPAMRGAMFGDATQPGAIPAAGQLFQAGPVPYYPGESYAGINQTQLAALGGQMDYLTSPEAMRGYNTLNRVSDSLIANAENLPNIPLAQASQVQAPQLGQAPVLGTASQAIAAGAGGPGVDYKPAMQRALSGQIDNPYLDKMSADIAERTTSAFNQNVAPVLRGQAQQAGGFGGSRQGIVEGLAAQGLNRDLAAQQNALYGGAYESAQNRAAQSGQALAGLDVQAGIASANNSTQTAMANAQAANQMAMENARMQYGNQQLGAQLGLQAGQYNAGNSLEAARINAQNMLAGVGAQNQALLSAANVSQAAGQIPMQNYQNMFGIGGTLQNDRQNQINADMARWQYESNAPWDAVNRYTGVLAPNSTLGSSQNQITPMYRNPLAGAVSGAATGAGIGTQVNPGWGTLIGGVVGAGAGYFGS